MRHQKELTVKPNDATGQWEIHDSSGWLGETDSESTAHRIVNSVNVHDELLHACRAAASYFARSRQWHAPESELLLNAIAKAEGKTR